MTTLQSDKLIFDHFNGLALNLEPPSVDKERLILDLYKVGAFSVTEMSSSFLVLDLAKAFSFPALFSQVLDLMWEKMEPFQADVIIGVPSTSLALAAALAQKKMLPLVIFDPYDTNLRIQGEFFSGQKGLLIGTEQPFCPSLETFLYTCQKEGLAVDEALFFLDNWGENEPTIEDHGIAAKYALTFPLILSTLMSREQDIRGEPPRVCFELS